MALRGEVKVIAGSFRGFTGIIIDQRDAEHAVLVEFPSGLSMWFSEDGLEVIKHDEVS